MKKIVLSPLLLLHMTIFAQKIDSIYFNLYTDSLKKGAFNYINVEGKFADGRIRPLDSTQLSFHSSYGKFSGNSLWVPFEAREEKVNITVISRQNPQQAIYKTIYIKKKNDDAQLKTVDEILADPPKTKSKKRNR
ncbi:MAG: hypothetical protein IT249_19040 [Chitinophagaceae bacterium]|nr:hypothetical protein [Chitinophagaceae bacterium]